MIEKIIIENFQRHKKLEIDLDRVTTIIGPTHTGKSSVVRALGLVCLNKWKSRYIRHGKKKTKIVLNLDAGREVKRVKGGKKNEYWLDGKKAVAFGQGKVPKHILSVLKIGPDNFHWQLDSHFWVSKSASELAKSLNEVVNLEQIDKTQNNIAAEVRKAKAEVDFVKERLSKAKKKLKELDWVPRFVKDGKELLSSRSEWKKCEKEARQLLYFTSRGQRAEKTFSKLVQAVATGKTAVAFGERVEKTRLHRKELFDILEKLKRAKTETRELPDFNPVVRAREIGDKIATDARDLALLLSDLENANEELTCQEKKAAKLRRTLSRSTPQTCPTCGRRI